MITDVVVHHCSTPCILGASHTSWICLALLSKEAFINTNPISLKISIQQDCHYEEEKHSTLSRLITEIMKPHPLSIFTIWKWISRCHIWASREWWDLRLEGRFCSSSLLFSLFPFGPESHLRSLGSVCKTNKGKMEIRYFSNILYPLKLYILFICSNLF